MRQQNDSPKFALIRCRINVRNYGTKVAFKNMGGEVFAPPWMLKILLKFWSSIFALKLCSELTANVFTGANIIIHNLHINFFFDQQK